MNARRPSQCVFNELQMAGICTGDTGGGSQISDDVNELQMADICIGLTGGGSQLSDKMDNVYLPCLDATPLHDGSAEDYEEILALASYLIRTWQTIETPAARIADTHLPVSGPSRCGIVGQDSALPPPCRFNRGDRKRRPAASSSNPDARAIQSDKA
jgi:hypothetical protein